MSAPLGNQFWKIRSKHGRDKLFSSPQILWDACCEYFEWCEENPLIEVDYRGKDADKVFIPKMRAFTVQGLCIFLECNTKYFNDLKHDKDFSEIIDRIYDTLYNQKFTGAAAGFLNANIISRDLGLQDRVEQKTTIIVKTSDDE